MMEAEVSGIFFKNRKAYYDSKINIIANQGGTRSTKTYSILQLLISISLESENLIIDIARKTQAEIRATVYSDFLEIIQFLNLYDSKCHNKTYMTYKLNNSLFRFVGMDSAQKKRGAKRDILFINEANDLTLEDWVQLNMRASGKIFIDFNPSESFWFHEYIQERKDCKTIHSTYKDNPFLPEKQRKEIERLIDLDDDYYYKVYVLGELTELRGRVYKKVNIISDSEYDSIITHDKCYGIDWGWNDPMVLVECKIYDGVPYYKELFYKSENRTSDLIAFMRKNRIGYDYPIYCDPSQPSSIDDFQLNNFPAMKADNSLLDGIKNVKKHGLNITEGSANLLRERKFYKYHEDRKTGRFVDIKPVDLNNHGMDCIRYIANTHETLRYRA